MIRGLSHVTLDVRPPRARIPGEGRSSHFHDDDNHLSELHSGTPYDRLRAHATAAEEDRA